MPTYNQQITSVSGNQVNAVSTVITNVKRAVIKATLPGSSPSQPSKTYEVRFPFGPKDLQFQEYNGRYNQIERPFKKPLNVFAGGSLRVVTFEAIIANRFNGGLTPRLSNGRGETVQDILDTLETISQNGATCDFMYGVTKLPFKCFLTQFSYTVRRRTPDGEPLICAVNLQLTEKIEYNPDARLLPLIVRPPVNISPSGGGQNKVYEEIYSLALPRFYGDGSQAAAASGSAYTLQASVGISGADALSLVSSFTIGGTFGSPYKPPPEEE